MVSENLHLDFCSANSIRVTWEKPHNLSVTFHPVENADAEFGIQFLATRFQDSVHLRETRMYQRKKTKGLETMSKEKWVQKLEEFHLEKDYYFNASLKIFEHSSIEEGVN